MSLLWGKREDSTKAEDALASLSREPEEVGEGVSNAEQAAMLVEATGRAPSVVRPENGQLGDWFHVGTIYFETGAATLQPSDLEVLRQIASTYDPHMRAGAEGTALLEGWADHRGDADQNLELARERAAAVSDALHGLFVFPPKVVPTGYGEEPEHGGDLALDRRVDVRLRAVPYDPGREREEAREGLPAMLDGAASLLEARGGTIAMRTARLLRLLEQPSVDDAYFDPGTARRYVLREYAQHGIEPDEMASRARIRALDLARSAGEDVERFADDMMHVSVTIFEAIEEIHKLYTINGEEYLSARVLFEWTKARQNDPGSVLFAHRA